jgi:hypothetical protein
VHFKDLFVNVEGVIKLFKKAVKNNRDRDYVSGKKVI